MSLFKSIKDKLESTDIPDETLDKSKPEVAKTDSGSFLNEDIKITVVFTHGSVRPDIEIENWQHLNARRLQQIERFVNRRLHELRQAELRKLESKRKQIA